MKTNLITTTVLCLVAYFNSDFVSAQNESDDSCYPTDKSMKGQVMQTGKTDFKTLFDVSGASVTFKRKELDQLHEMDTNTHVRVYFAITQDKFPQKMPFAIMVPFKKDNCSEDLTSKVLVTSMGDQKSVIVPGDTSYVQNGLSNWKSIHSKYDGLDTLMHRYGYNFSWDTIFAACSEDNFDLNVNFTMLQDTVNDSTAIHMVISDRWQQQKGKDGGGERVILDFSEPCPQFCGSLLNGSSSEAKKEDE